MKKRIWIIAAASVVVIALCVGGIIAYLSSKDKKTNEVEIAENKVVVEESFPDENKVQSFLDNKYNKEVEVKNTGNTPCYIRVFLSFPDSDMENKSFLSLDGQNFYSASASSGIAVLPADDDDTVAGTQYNGATFSNTLYSGKIVELTKDDANDADYWVYQNLGDGYYYYYTGEIDPQDATEKLMKYVMIYNPSDGGGLNPTDLYVYTESVQTKDAKGVDFTDYQDAWKNYYTKATP